VTLIRENLKKTHEERLMTLQRTLEIREARTAMVLVAHRDMGTSSKAELNRTALNTSAFRLPRSDRPNEGSGRA
jgi:hypothetical protein